MEEEANAAAAAEDETPDTEAPVFSLHAVVSVPICDTVQITVSLCATSLVALLDSGSTHTFIAEDAVLRTGAAHPAPAMTHDHGGQWQGRLCRRHPRRADLHQQHTVPVDLFVMPIAG